MVGITMILVVSKSIKSKCGVSSTMVIVVLDDDIVLYPGESQGCSIRTV